MADSKNTANDKAETVVEAPVEQVAQVQAAVVEDKTVGVGENLYFFPDIQKSVVANSLESAQELVQAELDAFKKNEGTK